MAFIRNASEEQVVNQICKDTGLQKNKAKIVLKCISKSDLESQVFGAFSSLPESKPGVFQWMMMIKKYNINISKLALTTVSFLLGFIPAIGTVLSGVDFFHDSSECFAKLSDIEKALLVYLREVCTKESNEVSVEGIYNGFVLEENTNNDFNNKEAINKSLDSLAEKGLIDIRVGKAIVKR